MGHKVYRGSLDDAGGDVCVITLKMTWPLTISVVFSDDKTLAFCLLLGHGS